MADLTEASAEKVTPEHAVLDEVIQDHGRGYTMFSIVCPLPSEIFSNEPN